MPLDRALHTGETERVLTCPTCGQVTTWSIEPSSVVDLREPAGEPADETVDLRESPEGQSDDSVEPPPNPRRNQR